MLTIGILALLFAAVLWYGLDRYLELQAYAAGWDAAAELQALAEGADATADGSQGHLKHTTK